MSDKQILGEVTPSAQCDDRPSFHFPQFPNRQTNRKSDGGASVRVLNNANTRRKLFWGGAGDCQKIRKGAYQILRTALPRNRKVSRKNRQATANLVR